MLLKNKMISIELSEKIESRLRDFEDVNSELRKRFEARREYWNSVIAPLEKAIDKSERLSERDNYILVY